MLDVKPLTAMAVYAWPDDDELLGSTTNRRVLVKGLLFFTVHCQWAGGPLFSLSENSQVLLFFHLHSVKTASPLSQ